MELAVGNSERNEGERERESRRDRDKTETGIEIKRYKRIEGDCVRVRERERTCAG